METCLRVIRAKRKKFESNVAVELEVLDFIDNAPTPTTNLLNDLVVRDDLANHMIPPPRTCLVEDGGFS
jgi:hypothetical protein